MNIPDDERNIVLTGFMGAGKTTVGKYLAELLNRPFIDSDDEIVARAGMSIPQIFERDGEAGFRVLEREVCAALAARRELVIATGGGMLIDADNRRLMLETGFVVCLNAPPEVIGARLALADDRPLAGDWAALLDKRRAVYALIPTHVDTEGKTPDQIAKEIVALWQA